MRVALQILGGAILLHMMQAEVAAQDKKDLLTPGIDQILGKVIGGTSEFQVAPMEGPVDPDVYKVGPSDGFLLNIGGVQNTSVPVTVSPEGTLIIPTVGEVRVVGLTLSQAKAAALSAYQRAYRAGTFSMTLVSPRRFSVAVTGSVLNQGSYVASATDRVDKVLVAANRMVMPSNTVVVEPSPTITYTPYYMRQRTALEQIQINNEQNQVSEILNRISTRNIVVYHKDGTKDRLDIPRFYATRVDRYDPYLRDGDVVFVPRKDLGKDFISIYGAVNNQATYEFVEGDSLMTLVELAGGLTVLADTAAVAIFRLDEHGNGEERISVPLAGILRGIARDVPLLRGDRVHVPERPQARLNYYVVVRGEVARPGLYPIQKDSTLLSDVIALAGGFLPQADLRSAEVIRGIPSVQESNMEKLLSQRTVSVLPREDTATYNAETNLRIIRGALSVDFSRLFGGKDASCDVYLRDGDVILVPPRLQTIYVFGQVGRPGYVPFVKGEDCSFYIAQAGGYTDRARRSDAQVIKSRTRQWVSPGATQIEAGDQIWIPGERERGWDFYWPLFKDVLTIASGLVTTVLLYVQFAKK